MRLQRLCGIGEPWPRGRAEARSVGKPGHGGEHAEPAEGAHDSADFLVLGKEAPLSEKNRPVTFLRADQGQGRGACVGHVSADVGKVFEEPEDGKGEAGGFALPEETGSAEERHEQFAESSPEDHDGVAEPTEKEMPALVDDQIDEIGEQKSGAIKEGVEKKQRVGAEPGDPGAARNRLPLTEFFFEEGLSAKRNKCGSANKANR